MRDQIVRFALLVGLWACSLDAPHFVGVDAQLAEDSSPPAPDATVDAVDAMPVGTDAAPDAAATVVLDLVAGDSVRAGLPTTVRWSATGVASCTAASGGAVPDWDGPLPTIAGERQVVSPLGIQTLTIACDDGGAGVSAMVVLAAMRLDVGTETLIRPANTTLDWEAPGAADCAGIAAPQVNGGLSAGGAYAASGHFMYFGPLGTSDQGFVCRDAAGSQLYRAVVHMVVQG
ncbi:MAG: hypothetical protein JNK64_26290 [Myxococcales bacterium]|nr:hypothetical protein [Myxococcales bacterium]